VTGFARVGPVLERHFDGQERALLRRLCEELAELMESAGDPAEVVPGDRVVARLLPDPYPDDAAASTEFQGFVRSRLAEDKAGTVRALAHDLSSGDADVGVLVRLDEQRIEVWLRGLTDLRLALFERAEEEWDRSQRRSLEQLLDWLGWLLSDLLDQLDG
jgi:hypothetical protein